MNPHLLSSEDFASSFFSVKISFQPSGYTFRLRRAVSTYAYPVFGEVESGRQLGDVDTAEVVRTAELLLEQRHLVLSERNARIATQLSLLGALLQLLRPYIQPTRFTSMLVNCVIYLIISKCIPVLLYGLEACPLVKSELSSLDFVINRFL